jgi:alcohol dehydrogenase
MADFTLKISPNITLGSYTVSRLGQFVQEWGTRFMLILDPVLGEYDISDKIKKSLSDRNIEFFVFDEIPSGADTTVLQTALELARKAHIHGIISAGGQKTENLGRAVATLIHESHSVYDYLDGATPVSGALPLICVPTTMHDLFLFADRTPVIDARTKSLKLLPIRQNTCKLALFDPNLCVGLTENQVSSISLQMLCIAIESYISQKSCFFSDTINEKAIELLSCGLDSKPALSSAVTPEQLLVQGGCMASLAAGISPAGAASLLACTINAKYKLSRSVITTILFPYIIEDAAKFKSDKLAKAARILKVASDTSSDDTAVNALVESIRERIAIANLPARLKDMGVSIEQLALAAENAGQLELMTSLPRSMSADELFDLIKQAY